MRTDNATRVGAYGFTIDAVLVDPDGAPIDISGATTLEIRFERPDASTVHLSAMLTTNGLDGGVSYLVASGDLNQAGDWRYQFDVITPALRILTDPVILPVGPNIP